MADEIEKLPGVGEKNGEKLRAAGFNNYMALAAASASELNEAGVAGEDTANKIINAARGKLKMGFELATEALKRRQLIGRITTGSTTLNGLLGGGVETQAITEAHGAFGCLTADAKITLSDGQLLPIGSFAKGLSAGVYPVNVPILAQSGSSIVKTDAVNLHVYNCDDVLRVNLHNGMSVSVTTNHPLMTPLGWKEAGNLSLQDRLKVVHDNVFSSNYVKLDTSLRKRIGNARQINLLTELTPELAEIIAYILGEGWKETEGDRGITRTCFTNTNKEMLDKFRELVSTVFKIEANVRYKRVDITAYAIDSVIACEFLEQFRGLYFNAKEKYIPDQIFSSPKEVIVRFLAALYDCEGSVKLDNIKEREREVSWITLDGEERSNVYRLPSYGRDIDLRSSSRKLLEGVQILLTKLGIDTWINQDVTRRDGKEFVGYKLHISNKDGIETFYKEIGIGTIRLRTKIEKVLESYKRNGVSRLADFVGIKSINVVKTPDGKVYDLEVPGLHNFLANNILSHNSGKSQLAHQLAVTVQLPIEKGGLGGKAIFVDTEQTFRPERIQDMANALGLDPQKALENIFVARAYNSDHQILLVEKSEEIIQNENVKLIIVDSLTANFRSDYTGRGQLADRQQTLNRHLHKLQRLADVYNLAVYITNQVMSRPDVMFGDPTAPIGGHVLGHQATYRLYLRKSKGEKRIGKLIDSPNLPEAETVFTVGKDGIRDDEESKE